MVAGLHTPCAGNLGIQAAIQYLVLNIRQQIHRSFFVANTLGIATGTETGTHEDMMFRFVHRKVLLSPLGMLSFIIKFL